MKFKKTAMLLVLALCLMTVVLCGRDTKQKNER